jgi:hypothetical protein
VGFLITRLFYGRRTIIRRDHGDSSCTTCLSACIAERNGWRASRLRDVTCGRLTLCCSFDQALIIGQIYDLTGPESVDLDHFARTFSEALGRPILNRLARKITGASRR